MSKRCFLLAFIFVHGLLKAQTDTIPFLLDSLLTLRMNEYKIQGLSIGIVKDGQLYYTKGYGFTDLSGIYPVTDNTRFAIASVTKLFTITAVMQWVEKGDLKLEGRLVEYLPDFKMRDDRYRDITLFQLVTHSSGLPWDNKLKNSPDDSTALHLLFYSLRQSKLNYKPGSKFSRHTYSNTGYDVLGYLVQQKAGVPFERYLAQNIFQLVGMTASTFDRHAIPEGQLAMPMKIKGTSSKIRGYNKFKIIPHDQYSSLTLEGYSNYRWGQREHNPDGYLYSTANDLSLWMKHLLDIYHQRDMNGQPVLSRPTLEEMWKPKLKIEPSGMSVGLGWWQNKSPYGQFVFHVGNDPGYCAILLMYPRQDFGLVILTNARYSARYIWNTLPFEIYAIIAGDSRY